MVPFAVGKIANSVLLPGAWMAARCRAHISRLGTMPLGAIAGWLWAGTAALYRARLIY